MASCLCTLKREKTDLIDDKYIYLKDVKNDYKSASHKQNLGLKYIHDNYNFDYVIFISEIKYKIKDLLYIVNQCGTCVRSSLQCT